MTLPLNTGANAVSMTPVVALNAASRLRVKVAPPFELELATWVKVPPMMTRVPTCQIESTSPLRTLGVKFAGSAVGSWAIGPTADTIGLDMASPPTSVETAVITQSEIRPSFISSVPFFVETTRSGDTSRVAQAVRTAIVQGGSTACQHKILTIRGGRSHCALGAALRIVMRSKRHIQAPLSPAAGRAYGGRQSMDPADPGPSARRASPARALSAPPQPIRDTVSTGGVETAEPMNRIRWPTRGPVKPSMC